MGSWSGTCSDRVGFAITSLVRLSGFGTADAAVMLGYVAGTGTLRTGDPLVMAKTSSMAIEQLLTSNSSKRSGSLEDRARFRASGQGLLGFALYLRR